ncbi:hypothetical protein BB560_002394 [Smittium megazygosporum]|uniref:Prolyl endopeptidase-like n=1 Tax=Smittium megazygosporum TaxID=133381 RepID=A0A2T9ZEW6_9FUNG|nr:hypothetical protein BB560_002394 [Smittium megazygosporum]
MIVLKFPFNGQILFNKLGSSFRSFTQGPNTLVKSESLEWMKNPKNDAKLRAIVENEKRKASSILGLHSFVRRSSKFNKVKNELNKYLEVEKVFEKSDITTGKYSYGSKIVYDSSNKFSQYYYCDNETGTKTVLFDEKLIFEEYSAMVVDYEHSLNGNYILIKFIHRIEKAFKALFGQNKQIFFTVINDQMRVDKVFMFLIPGHESTNPNISLVYNELEQNNFVDISKTKDEKFIIINSNSLDSSELYVIKSDFVSKSDSSPFESNQKIPLMSVRPRQKNIEIYLDHICDYFVVLSNASINQNNNDESMKIYKAPNNNPHYTNWEPWITFSEDHIIIKLDLPFEDGAFSLEPISNLNPREISFQINVFSGDYHSKYAEFAYASPLQIRSNGKWDLESGKIVKDNRLVSTHWDILDYDIRTVEVEAENGIKIPATIIQKHVLIQAGGGELGKEWYNQGRVDHKKNSINDLIQSIVEFQANGFCDPKSTAIAAASAGGLVACSASLQSSINRKELASALVLNVPFLDPLGSLCDPDLPLSRLEIDEWGDPIKDKGKYKLIEEYSPNELLSRIEELLIKDREHAQEVIECLPSTLILAGYKDNRVPIWHSTKWVSKLNQIIGMNAQCDRDRKLINMFSGFQNKKNNKIKDILLYVDLEKSHFDDTMISAGNYQYDSYSHKVIRNIFLEKYLKL